MNSRIKAAWITSILLPLHVCIKCFIIHYSSLLNFILTTCRAQPGLNWDASKDRRVMGTAVCSLSHLLCILQRNWKVQYKRQELGKRKVLWLPRRNATLEICILLLSLSDVSHNAQKVIQAKQIVTKCQHLISNQPELQSHLQKHREVPVAAEFGSKLRYNLLLSTPRRRRKETPSSNCYFRKEFKCMWKRLSSGLDLFLFHQQTNPENTKPFMYPHFAIPHDLPAGLKPTCLLQDLCQLARTVVTTT